MSLIAELRLSGEQTTLYRALQAAPEMHLELERAVVPVEGEPALYLWATGEGFDSFEAATTDDPTVVQVEAVEEIEERRFYRVVVDRSETTDSATFEQQVGASRLSASATAAGVDFRIRFPDWPALQRYVDLVREAGLDVRLQTVSSATDGHSPEQYDLSGKQLEILQKCLDAGYFDVPRGTDLTTLADELGISEQAASERLRRGLASLLAATVGDIDDAAATAWPRALSVDGSSDPSDASAPDGRDHDDGVS